MRRIRSETVSKILPELTSDQVNWIYNTLDCCLTHEIHSKISPQLDKDSERIYSFEQTLYAPALEMMLRGILVDTTLAWEMAQEYRTKAQALDTSLQEFANAYWGRNLNPNSPKQLQEFFYDCMGIPEVRRKGRVTTDRDALESFHGYLYARPFVKYILTIKDFLKRVSVLTKGIDPDNRIRTSYNVAGTETGRWSSSTNAFGTGDNLQNWNDEIKRILVADPGKKLAYVDLEQAESRVVGMIVYALFGESNYLDACESGDLHTTVCKMVWPKLGWGEGPDRKIADKLFYRDFSYRDMAKRGGHGCLTPDHEVLTPTGWVPITEKPARIMAYSDQSLSWEEPSHWEDKHWEGTLVKLRGTSLSANLTSDHRIVFYKDKKVLHEEPAINFSYKGKIPLGDAYCQGTYNEPLAELVAAYQCDGYQKSTNRVEFHFKKERKFRRLEMLAKAADIKYERKLDKAYLHWNCPYPKEAGAYLFNWNYNSLINYITEHANWDGYTSNTNATTVSSVNKQHLEWIQTIGRVIGIGGNFNKPRISGFGSKVYRLQQNNRKFAAKTSIIKTTEEYSGRVLCPTVKGGAFLIRHNGKISITGNTNYFGKPWTMARHLKVETEVMQSFQDEYFLAFPGIRRWHQHVAQTLQTSRPGVMGKAITTFLGRRRFFFGRPTDDATLREAIAFEPQSIVGDLLNLGLYRVWKSVPEVELLAQIHDAIAIQYPEELEAEVLPKVQAAIEVPMKIAGRGFLIPSSCEVGWNLGHYMTEEKAAKLRIRPNYDGLKTWKGSDDRQRKRPAEATLLDCLVSGMD